MGQRQLVAIIGLFVLGFGLLVTLSVMQHFDNEDVLKRIGGLNKEQKQIQETGNKLKPLALTIDGYNQVKDAFRQKLPDPSNEEQARDFILSSIDSAAQSSKRVIIPEGQVSWERPNIEDEFQESAAAGGTESTDTSSQGKNNRNRSRNKKGGNAGGGGGGGDDSPAATNIMSFSNFSDYYVQFPVEATLFQFAEFLNNLERNDPFIMVDTFQLSPSGDYWTDEEGNVVSDRDRKKYITSLRCRTFFFREPSGK